MSKSDTAAKGPAATDGSLDRLLAVEAGLAARHEATRAEAERIRAEGRSALAAADEACARDLQALLEEEDRAAALRRDSRLAAIHEEAACRAAALRALRAERLAALADLVVRRVLASDLPDAAP